MKEGGPEKILRLKILHILLIVLFLYMNHAMAQLDEVKLRGEVIDINLDGSELLLRITEPIEAVNTEFSLRQSGGVSAYFLVLKQNIKETWIATGDTCKIFSGLGGVSDINVGDIVEVFGYYLGNNDNYYSGLFHSGTPGLIHYLNLYSINHYIKECLFDEPGIFWSISDTNYTIESLFVYMGDGVPPEYINPPRNTPPTITSLTPDVKSPQEVGASITWTALAKDPENDPIYYQFWLKGPSTGMNWKVTQNYSLNSSWSWVARKENVGTSDVRIWIADGKHAGPTHRDDHKEYITYQIKSEIENNDDINFEELEPNAEHNMYGPASSRSLATSNQPPRMISLAPSISSPQEVGAPITWTAIAKDLENDLIYYQFWLRGSGTGGDWQLVQDWSTNNAWSWKTKEKNVGSSDVRVGTRDGNHADPKNMDDFKESYDYKIVDGSNQPPSLISLAPNLQGPQEIGSIVAWIATATDPDNDPLYYKFWLNGPKTSGNWQAVQDWSTSNTWSWNIQNSDMGSSSVRVWIRDGKHAGIEDTDSFKEYNDYQIKAKQLAQLYVQVTNDVYSENDRHLYYCQDGKYISFKNRIYLIGPDLDKVKSVKYVLHESFQDNPAPDSVDSANNFELWIMTWGRFPIKALITTTNGQIFEKDYEFSFKSKVEEAKRRGIPMVRRCE